MVDPHLNLFYSYSMGNAKNPDEIKILEDNVTRAFIILLKEIWETDKKVLKKYLNELFQKHLNSSIKISKELHFDLQNLDPKTLSKVKGKKQKILITIQTVKSDFTKAKISDELSNHSWDKFNQLIKEIESNKGELSDIKNKIKEIDKSDNKDFIYKNIQIDHRELISFYQTILGNRPDAWIIGEDLAIMFESKVRFNKVSFFQLYRHLSGNNGFSLSFGKIKAGEGYELVNFSWEDVVKILEEVKEEIQEKKLLFLIEQFVEYLKIGGEIMDLSYLTKNDSIDPDIHKNQFNLLLEKLEKKMSVANLPIYRGKRPKDKLWEYFGVKGENNKIKMDPHYSVYFLNDLTALALTIKDVGKKKNREKITEIINDILINDSLKLFSDVPDNLLNRYYFKFVDYGLVDPQKGQIKGDKIAKFELKINFAKIKNNKIKKDDLLKLLSENIIFKIAKQFEFGYEIVYLPKREKGGYSGISLREENINLLLNPDKLIEEYVDFINNTFNYFQQLLEK